MEKKDSNTDVFIANKSVMDSSVVLGPNCKSIKIGYGCYIGESVYIDVPELILGDYTTIHKHTTIHGSKSCRIGHNCWIGQNTIIDTIGGMYIGNNVGIGTYSQLWSHMKFGDKLNGCKWYNEKPMIIEDDVWIVGHCLLSPIHAKKGSMAMLGSLITRDMEENSIYAGTPARDLTNRLGNQFREIGLKEKTEMFKSYYNQFLEFQNVSSDTFKLIEVDSGKFNIDGTIFHLLERTYIPTRSENEYRFLKFLLYEKAKFIPTQN